MSSFLASQRDMLDSVHRVLGTTDADWTIEPTAERYQRGLVMMNEGGANAHRGFGICSYSRTFYPNGGGNFQDKLDNDVLGLPEEDFDEATARAIKMAEAKPSY